MMFYHKRSKLTCIEKKQTINSWKRHALCDSMLSYGRNRYKEKYGERNMVDLLQ